MLSYVLLLRSSSVNSDDPVVSTDGLGSSSSILSYDEPQTVTPKPVYSKLIRGTGMTDGYVKTRSSKFKHILNNVFFEDVLLLERGEFE